MRSKTHVIVERTDFDKAIEGLVSDENDFQVQSILVKVNSVQLNGTVEGEAKQAAPAPVPTPAPEPDEPETDGESGSGS